MSNLFFVISSFIMGVFFTALGLIGLMIPWDPATRTAVVQFIFENSIIIMIFGFAFAIIGIGILVNLGLSFRKRQYTIRSGIKAVMVEEPILQEYLQSYWKEAFPSHDIPNRLTLKKNKIHVYADLPFIPKPQQKSVMEKIRQDLSELLSSIFGYRQDLTLSISFQRENKSSGKEAQAIH